MQHCTEYLASSSFRNVYVLLICHDHTLQEEVAAEKEKAKEEAEDLTQEMAELRYQLMEMIEQERELRAQTEQASVLRVVELESQVNFLFRFHSFRMICVVFCVSSDYFSHSGLVVCGIDESSSFRDNPKVCPSLGIF